MPLLTPQETNKYTPEFRVGTSGLEQIHFSDADIHVSAPEADDD
jgi:hypothetical protein